MSRADEGLGAERLDDLSGDVDAMLPRLVELSASLFATPELAFQEHHAVAAVGGTLRAHGHDFETGIASLPTAFRATVGTGRPHVALLAEYDALEDLGHACGHNVICAAAVGAFLAAGRQRPAEAGRVSLIGTPGEEGGGGKAIMLQTGVFDDVDAALMVHPADVDIADHAWLGMRRLTVRYHGVPAHASMAPFHGRNALDAAVLAYQSIAMLRQHLHPGERVHGVLRDGGRWPSVVPDRTDSLYFVRAPDTEGLDVLSDRISEACIAAARATGTTEEMCWDEVPRYEPVRNDADLCERYAAHMARLGREVASGVDHALVASTDFGNVSQVVRGLHPLLRIAPPGTRIHEREFVAHALGEGATTGIRDAAIALAAVALDVVGTAPLESSTKERSR